MCNLTRFLVVPLLCVGWLQAQERPSKPSISDVTLSVIGNAKGLDSYITTLKNEITRKWIEAWPSDAHGPTKIVLTLHINYSGYLDSVESAVSQQAGTEQMQGAVQKAVTAVFTKLPPDPPKDLAQSQILVKAVFVYGAEKPQG
jgi:TonB C terminal